MKCGVTSVWRGFNQLGHEHTCQAVWCDVELPAVAIGCGSICVIEHQDSADDPVDVCWRVKDAVL